VCFSLRWEGVLRPAEEAPEGGLVAVLLPFAEVEGGLEGSWEEVLAFCLASSSFLRSSSFRRSVSESSLSLCTLC
jgi:hypothetical protein